MCTSKNFKQYLLNDMILRNNSILIILALCLFLTSCQNKKKKDTTVDFITETSGNVDFGKTDVSAYTPEIRDNMKKLYEDKFGMFVHWGPYAQLEGIWDGKKVAAEWIMKRGFIPVKDYEREAAGKFKPVNFNAGDWVDIAESAGMKFIVLTAKHHDGFAMYKSKHPYNLVDFAGFGRDIYKELSTECAKRDMKLGFYYSQSQDWHEKGGVGNDWDFGSVLKPQEDYDAYFNDKVAMQVEELTQNYGDIFMVWFDTPIQMNDEKCQLMMDIVKENQPGALVNSRLGNGFGHFDVSIDNGKTPSVSKATWLSDLKVPWQTHESVTQGGWGYTSYGAELDRSADYSDFIYSFCRIVGNGGVYLLNVAPRPDGTIPESQANSLRAIGDWLEVNGEAIYGADPSPLKFSPYAITSKPGKVYLHFKDLEQNQVELTGLLSKVTNAYCLADSLQQSLTFDQKNEKLSVTIPTNLIQPRVTVIVLEIEDVEAKVIDETLQQEQDGTIQLPVAKCEFAIRRISYDYDKQLTIRWGENIKQGLIWTVNVKQPGTFKVISEDNGNDGFVYNIISPTDTLELHAKGNIGKLTKKQQDGVLSIDHKGVQKILVYPKIPASKATKNSYNFKGLELVPVD
jgi:alpha-L-fucosidase